MQNRTARFSFDDQSTQNAKIKVIGVGGGGGNAINNMIMKGLNNVEYIALNTDAQALASNQADIVIQVGKNLTQGLGAGARPEVGREAVEENRHEIEEAIEGSDMVFITCGMGGGTGTGGAPIVAGIAKRKGILTIGVVTTPFVCEGKVRGKYAIEGVNELKKNCDTVIVIPNERLLDISDDNTTIKEAFEMANEVLFGATRGISDLILMPGIVNLDFADIKTTMLDGGAAVMGSAKASGPDRAEIAVRSAISSPLLDGISIRGARNVLVNISGSENLGLKEVNSITSLVHEETGEDAEIILGTVISDEYTDEISVTVIATGFELSSNSKISKPVTTVRNSVDGELAARKTGSTLQIPKIDSLGTRNPGRAIDPYYKGEENLKALDVPTIFRKEAARKSIQEVNETQAPQPFGFKQNRQVGGMAQRENTLLNNRTERIDKSDSEQPAFLRKIMD